MTHSSVVVDGHEKTTDGRFNLRKPETKGEEFHPYMRYSNRFLEL